MIRTFAAQTLLTLLLATTASSQNLVANPQNRTTYDDYIGSCRIDSASSAGIELRLSVVVIDFKSRATRGFNDGILRGDSLSVTIRDFFRNVITDASVQYQSPSSTALGPDSLRINALSEQARYIVRFPYENEPGFPAFTPQPQPQGRNLLMWAILYLEVNGETLHYKCLLQNYQATS
jgi:hypothetical protein